MSQEIKTLSNTIQLEQRGVVALRKSLNEIEAQISDLDVAKERAKQGKYKEVFNSLRQEKVPEVWCSTVKRRVCEIQATKKTRLCVFCQTKNLANKEGKLYLL